MSENVGIEGPHVGSKAVWGVASMVVLLGIVDVIATFAVQRPWTWRSEILITASWWVLWLPLVPLVGRIANRFRFGTGSMVELAIGHVTAAMILSLVHLMAVATINWEVNRFGGAAAVSWVAVFARFLGVPFLVFDIATYGGIAAALTAAGLARESHMNEVLAERLRAQAKELEASVVQAKLDTLRMQLNPHFLFNALNAVSGLVVRGRASDAQEMLGRLGGLLRETLKTEQTPFLSVADEIELLNDFLYIEQIRFGDRLKVSVIVDEAAAQGRIPAMLLQPLVENAVRHGVEPTLEQGTISVHVSRVKQDLLVRIDDSGIGFPIDNGALPREGIGLTNTRARLQQLFGELAWLRLSNRPDGGARVELSVPWRPPLATEHFQSILDRS